MSTVDLFVWAETRRLADELEVEVYFASMETRARWHTLELRLCKLERIISRSDEQLAQDIVHELYELRAALRALCDAVCASGFASV